MERRPTGPSHWPEATYVNLENDPSTTTNYRPHSTNYSPHNGLRNVPTTVESISIPRPKYWQQRQTRISDEFWFLEERNNTFPLRSTNPNYPPEQSYNKYLFVSLATIQIITSIGLLVFACFRHFQLLNRPNPNALLDFVKVEDYVSSNQDGTDLIGIKLGTSIFLPAILQLIAGLTGLYPLKRRPPKSLYILCIIFAGFSVLFWFRPIVYAIFELNLRNIQLQTAYNSSTHWLFSFLLILFALDIFVINSVLLIYANLQLASSIRTLNHVLDVHMSMLSVIMSVLCIGCSIYAVSNTMTKVDEWGQDQHNVASLYGFGLRELIISFYLLLTVSLNCASIITRRKNIRQTALTLQILGLLCLFYELLNEDRLLAASHNIRVMFNQGISEPISPEIILVLYTFLIVLTAILGIQVFSTALNVFKSPVCDLYSSPPANIQPISHIQSSL